MKRSKFSETQIIAILNEADAGLSMKEINLRLTRPMNCGNDIPIGDFGSVVMLYGSRSISAITHECTLRTKP